MADYKVDEENIKDDEREREINSTIFIPDFKRVAVFAGVVVYAYLIGKQNGIDFGYVKGYKRCIDNITEVLVTTNKA